ncbi:hypothetical protein AND_005392 [Anopheles darlingi]|uniref:Uncharacterized protein n=1 Tax=Anopheles darlingi TaxID=43151 RepID=W5JEY4_ANODA|nr:hypothetical protein AND_005392 [Anopheles darlingi]
MKNSKLEVVPEETGSKLTVAAAEIPKGIPLCPFRVSSKATIVDDSEEFTASDEPLSKLGSDKDGLPRRLTAIEWYRLHSNTYGVTSFTAIERVLHSIEQSPSKMVELDFNRCGYSNLHIQIALDALLRIRPTWVTVLDLSHNQSINSSLARFLGNALQELQTIAYLSLSYCTLDDECVSILSDALSNSGVTTLHAEHCQITDRGGSALFRALAYSDCIEKLFLSWNQLEVASGVAIGAFLAVQRTTISELHLAGNQLYREQSAIPLLKGLIGNEAITYLDLSWNGLRGEEIARTLLKAVQQTKLLYLSLEHNLLATEEMPVLVKLMAKSESLQELHLGGNYLTEECSIDLIKAFTRSSSMLVLSLGPHYFITTRAVKLCRLCRKRNPQKTIIYRGVLLNNPPRPVDVQEMLLDRARFLATKPKKPKLKRDFGHLMLQLQALVSRTSSDGEDPATVSRDEFAKAVKTFRVKLDRPLLEAMMDAFAVGRDQVNVAAMATKYLTKHPTAERPVEKSAERRTKAK